jgi:hypothetical protein
VLDCPAEDRVGARVPRTFPRRRDLALWGRWRDGLEDHEEALIPFKASFVGHGLVSFTPTLNRRLSSLRRLSLSRLVDRADARTRTGDPFITRQRRVRHSRPRETTEGHKLPGKRPVRCPRADTMNLRVPALPYPICTRHVGEDRRAEAAILLGCEPAETSSGSGARALFRSCAARRGRSRGVRVRRPGRAGRWRRR